MIKSLREQYNQSFTAEKYNSFLKTIEDAYNYMPTFRIAETPIFIPDDLKEKLLEACEDIRKLISRPDFKELTKDAIKNESQRVPGEDNHPLFLQMDFGITRDNDGNLHPQLIELQGFPSLYYFQDQLARAFKKIFDIPGALTTHPEGHTNEEYLEILRKAIVGDHHPENVILLEVEPWKQNTAIDFYGTVGHRGVRFLCRTDLKKNGRKLFYLDNAGKEVAVKKIYNRIIFDELDQRTDLKREFYFKDDVDVEWIGHPAWFFRISKYILPFFDSKYVPKTFFLDELKEYPYDLENYVLKPLYSFAGSGIQLDITPSMLGEIKEKENYILQQKVNYAEVIKTPSEPAKCEIRMMMVWEKDQTEGRVVNNLVRLTKGRMVGVKFNKNKDWVGASVGFFNT
ncbi:hypothetical protein BH23BAC2_BH23BAC2_13240 [soil metagenome]